MKDIVILGTGHSGELAAFYFREDAGRRVAAFTLDAAYITQERFCDAPVVSFETVETLYPPADFEIFIAMGYRELNKARRRKLDEARAKGYRAATYISSRATTFSTFEARENQFILEDNTIQPFVSIGENTTLWSGNHIGHHSTIGADNFLASHIVVSGSVTIGDRCFIGVNATIRDGVTIGSDCVIGAGALVLKDVPDGTVISPKATEASPIPSSRLRNI